MSTPTNIQSETVYYTLLGGDSPGVYTYPIFIKPGKFYDLEDVAWPICIHCGTNERKAVQMLGLHSILDVLGFHNEVQTMARDIWNHQAISDYISRNPELSGPYFAVVWAGRDKGAMIYSNQSDYEPVIAGHCGARLVKHTVNIQQALVYMLLRSHVEGFQFTPIPTSPSTPSWSGALSTGAPSTPRRMPGQAGSSSGSPSRQARGSIPIQTPPSTQTSSSTHAITYGDDMPPPVYTPAPWQPHSTVGSAHSLPRATATSEVNNSPPLTMGQAPPYTPLSPQPSPSPMVPGVARTGQPIYTHMRSIDGIIATFYEGVRPVTVSSYRDPTMSVHATRFFDAFGFTPEARATIARLYRDKPTCESFSKELCSLSHSISRTEAQYIWVLMNSADDH